VLGVRAAQRLDVGELRAGVDERHRRLLFAEAVDLHALGQQPHHQRGEVGVAGDDRETVEVAGVQQVHRVDHHRHVRGVLAGGVGELLDRPDRVLVQHRFPRLDVRALPVAVGAAHVGHAMARDLVEDGVDLRRRRVVRVDQQRDPLLDLDHGAPRPR
jgi:hypothetical protein